jgi:hypothetical protein
MGIVFKICVFFSFRGTFFCAESGHKRMMEVPTLAGCGANVVAPTRCACSGQEHVLEAPNASAGCDEVRYQTSSASEVRNGIGEELVLEVPPLVVVSGESGHKRMMEVPTLAGCGANVVAPTRCACSGQELVLEAPNASAGCDEVRY